MATSALAILSLADAKKQLRVTGSGHDAMITDYIGAAVKHIETLTGLALVRRTEEITARAPESVEDPIIIRARGLTGVTSVKLWSESRGRNLAADQTITSLGRLERMPPGHRWRIWPATEWPEHREEQGAIVTATLELAAIPDDLVQAVSQLVANLYDGEDLNTCYSARALAMPHRAFD